MNRCQAPNHPDCFIVCDGDGWALYIEKYGPCSRRCDASTFALNLANTAARNTFAVRVSGSVIGDAAEIASGFSKETFGILRQGVQTNFDREIVDFFEKSINLMVPNLIFQNRSSKLNDDGGKSIALDWHDLDVADILWILRRNLISALGAEPPRTRS